MRNAIGRLLDRFERIFASNFWREEPLVKILKPHLEKSAEILDLGAGSCKLAQLLCDRTSVSVVPLDVVDHNMTDLTLEIYDGITIPYRDEAFDAVLLVFTLHHAADMDRLIREAMRVSKFRIIVVEDAPRNFIEHWLWRMWDRLLNHAVHSDVEIAEIVYTIEEWIILFSAYGLKVVNRRSFRIMFPTLGVYRMSVFVLDKQLGQP